MGGQYWLRRHPVLIGFAVGLVYSCVAVIMMGLLPRCPLEWSLLAMVSWGFGRPVSAQAAMLIPICLVGSIFSGLSVFVVMLPIIVALVLAHLLTRCEEVSRWGSEHFGNLVVISAVYYVTLLGFISIHRLLISLFVYIVLVGTVMVFLFSKRVVRPFQKKTGNVSWRLADRR